MNTSSIRIHILTNRPNVRDIDSIKTFILPHIKDSEIRLVPDETYNMGQESPNVEIYLFMFKGEHRDYFIRVSADLASGEARTIEIC